MRRSEMVLQILPSSTHNTHPILERAPFKHPMGGGKRIWSILKIQECVAILVYNTEEREWRKEQQKGPTDTFGFLSRSSKNLNEGKAGLVKGDPNDGNTWIPIIKGETARALVFEDELAFCSSQSRILFPDQPLSQRPNQGITMAWTLLKNWQ